MNENDKTEILEPVETPAENITEPSKDGRKCPKWLLPLVAAVCAVILVVAGIIGWNAYSGAKLAEAKEACATAADTVRNNANEYNALLNGDAADAAAVKAEQVKDSKTVESLGKELKAMAPEYEGCVAENAQGLDAAAVKLNEQADWYETHEKSLSKAVDAVNDSKLAKTIDTAKTLLESSNGNVQDDKTREELSKAIEAKDEAAIAKASKAVNDSIAAKQKADEEAKAKAQAEADAKAAAAANAQTQQQQYNYQQSQPQQSWTPSYPYGGGSTGGGSGTTGGSTGGSAGSSYGGSFGYSSSDNFGGARPGGTCPEKACGV